MSLVAVVVTVVVGYLIGAVPFGYLVARARGVDIFAQGSGNIGATNVGRVLGRKFGILVFVLDFLKGAGPTLAAWLLGPRFEGEGELLPNTLAVCAAVAAVLGHSFPVYLRFRGGKGVATGAGVAAVLLPLPLALALLAWVVVVGASRTVSLASLVSATFLCILHLGFGVEPFGRPGAVLSLFCLAATGLVFVRHRDNIGRLLRGQENQLKDSAMLHAVSKLLHVWAVGLWFGMGLFFTFVVDLGMFNAWTDLGQQDDRPPWFPKQQEYKKRDLGPKIPDPGKEQGSRAFGHAVEPLFHWYYPLQMGCALVALGTALGWRGRFLDRGRQGVIALALLTVVAGWWLEHKVNELRGPRNELTDKVLTADAPTTTMVAEAEQARDAFGMWHGISVTVNLVTVVLVVVAMSLAAWLPRCPASAPPNAGVELATDAGAVRQPVAQASGS